MITIRTLTGADMSIDPQSVVRIAGPRPHDVGPRAYVDGPAAGTIITAESPEALLVRLAAKPPLAKLTRPDGTPVWVKASAVGAVRAPVASETDGTGDVNAVLSLGGLHQAVRETVAAVQALVAAG